MSDSPLSPMGSILETLRIGHPETDRDLEHMQTMDWSSTSLGPISSWSSELSTVIYLAMLSPQPQLFLLGPELLYLYNTAYSKLLRDHHPSYFGKPVSSLERLAPNASIIGHIVELASHSRRPAYATNVQFIFMNDGHFEELFLSATMVLLPPPLVGYSATTEDNTNIVVQKRRNATLEDMSSKCGSAKDLTTLWQLALQSLSGNHEDVPFAAIYSSRVKPDSENDSNSSGDEVEPSIFDLEGVVGDFDVPPPNFIDLISGKEPYLEAMCQATTSRVPTLLNLTNESLPESWSQASRTRGHGDDCREAVIFPSSTARHNEVRALLVVGIAPRRPYDEAYQAWIRKLRGTLSEIVASILSAHAKALKKKAAAEKARLEKELFAKEIALRETEAFVVTNKFRKMVSMTRDINVGIFEYLPTGELLEGNDVFHRLSGYPRDPNLNKPLMFIDLSFEEDAENVMAQWNILLTGQSVTFEMRWRCASPEGRWVQAACAPVMDQNGVITSISGCTTNIDAQKKVEMEAVKRGLALEQARASEARFLNFAHNAPIGILIVGLDRRSTFINNFWFELTGHPRGKNDEVKFGSVIYEEDVDLNVRKWNEILEEGKPVEFQTRLKRQWYSSGKLCGQVWVMITAFPEFHEDGSLKQIMSAAVDISHFKLSEQLQQTRLEEVIEAKRQQENFIDMTSHEIRNPLSAVMHCADSTHDSLAEMKKLLPLLASSAQDSDKSNAISTKLHELIESSIYSVETISSCSAHQKRITDDILSLSKLDSNLLQISPTTVRAADMLQDLQRTFGAEAERAGVVIETQLDVSMEQLGIEWVKLDPGRAQQVLVNLLTNAVKFTKNQIGGRKVTVYLGASKERPTKLPKLATDDSLMQSVQANSKNGSWESTDSACYIWFAVEDTGCGMTVKEKAKIFSRFTQASPRTYNEYGGSGLGLFISRKLIELQGGEIGFTSEFGAGSTFSFFIRAQTTTAPIHTAVENVMPAISKLRLHSFKIDVAEGTHGPSIDSEAEIAHPQYNVLIVEDNIVNQKVLKKQLLKHGYQVNTADNGQEALEYIQTTRHWTLGASREPRQDIHVILMDIEMPVMDGLECSRKIRELQQAGHIANHIPIIAVSANARPEQIKIAIDAGMDHAIPKPFRIKDLTPMIDRLAEAANF